MPIESAPAGKSALLGVSGYATEAGFKITLVRAGSPAALTYLNLGESIVRIDDREVQSSHDIEAGNCRERERNREG